MRRRIQPPLQCCRSADVSDSITEHERAILKAARDGGGTVRFETWTHRKLKIETVDGIVVVTTYFDMSITMESRGWFSHVRAPKVYTLTEAGWTRAKRIR